MNELTKGGLFYVKLIYESLFVIVLNMDVTAGEAAKSFESPSAKNVRGKRVSSGQRLMIINSFKSFEGCISKLSRSRTETCHEVSELLGIGIRTVRKVITEYERNGTITSPKKKKNRTGSTIFAKMDEFTKHAIRMTVHAFFQRKEIPTLDTVLAAINSDPDLPDLSRTSLSRILHKLQFVYEKRNRKSMLIDREEIVRWRRSYLRKIKDYRRANRKIYYLDETWVTAGHTTGKAWVDRSVKSYRDAFLRGLSTGIENPTGKGNRLIIVHIGSETGFVDGGLYVFEASKSADYHAEMTGEVFKAWFQGEYFLIVPCTQRMKKHHLRNRNFCDNCRCALFTRTE